MAKHFPYFPILSGFEPHENMEAVSSKDPNVCSQESCLHILTSCEINQFLLNYSYVCLQQKLSQAKTSPEAVEIKNLA